MRFCWLLLPLIALPVVAADPPAAMPKHRVEGDAAIAARRVLIEHCAACHGDPDKKKRQGRLWVTNWTSLVGNAGDAGPISFISLDKDDLRSQVLEFMKDGSMPPGGRKPVPPEQVKEVEDWIKKGASEYPSQFDDANVLEVIVADLARVEKDKGKGQVSSTRYVSFAHLVDKKGADLDKADAELVAALAERLRPGATPADVVGKVLTPVPGTAGTVFRLDIKALGWGLGDKYLFERAEAGDPKDEEFRMIPFDLIQLEYPYAHIPTEKQKWAVNDALTRMNAHRKTEKKDPLSQLRAVPFLRGDWLAAALRRNGKATPLAKDLDALVNLTVELGKTTERHAGEGPDFSPFQGGGKPPVDATAPSMWAWYQAEVSPAQPAFQFAVTVEKAKEGGFRMIATSDRPVVVSLVELQVDYVDVLRFDKQTKPSTEVDKQTAISLDGSGRMKPTILAANKGRPLYYLLFVSPKASAHREPVVVRSRHAKGDRSGGVWRVLPNEADAAEGEHLPPIRKVLQVELKTAD